MKTYTVTCTIIYNGTATIQAESEEQAMEIAEEQMNEDNLTPFPDSAKVGSIHFSLGECTADYADEHGEVDEVDLYDDDNEYGKDGKYICRTPREYLALDICTFVRDRYEDSEGVHDGYYGQAAIYDIRDGEDAEALTDWVDDHCIPGELLEGIPEDDREEKARELFLEYMHRNEAELLDRYFNGDLDM